MYFNYVGCLKTSHHNRTEHLVSRYPEEKKKQRTRPFCFQRATRKTVYTGLHACLWMSVSLLFFPHRLDDFTPLLDVSVVRETRCVHLGFPFVEAASSGDGRRRMGHRVDVLIRRAVTSRDANRLYDSAVDYRFSVFTKLDRQ